MRTRLLILTALFVLAVVLPALAQETADICLGGGLVARLRAPGTFKTIGERASSTDKMIVEIVSAKDTQHPQVALKQKNKLWTVYAWEIPVLTVYPAEAKTNKMAEKDLGTLWANNLRTLLPKATPCSKLPPEQLGYGKPAVAKPATAAAPVTTTATKPVAVTVAKPAAAPARPTSTMTGNESGAMLLIVDAIRTAREMNDQDWSAQKEVIARSLYSDLSYYMTGKGAPPAVPATTKPATTPKPVTPKPAVTAKPATAKPPTGPTATVTTPAVKPAPTPATDASMAKVPQKTRIHAKFAAAKVAYDKLKVSDPPAAEGVAKMLASSRNAFAAGKFDESEQQVDAALAAMGVEFKE